MSERFLVVGIDGLLGANAQRCLPERGFEVLSSSHRREACANLHLDIEAEIDLSDLPSGVSHALFCPARTAIDDCGRNPRETRRFNVERTILALDALMDRGVVPIFCSSDVVYPGDEGRLYDEDSPRAPRTEYGRHKLAVEDHLAASRRDYLVIRMSKLFSLAEDDTSGTRRTAEALRAGQPVRAATDQYLRPIHVEDVLEAVARLARKRLTGTFNLVPPPGEGSLTRHDLARRIALAIGADQSLIETCSIDEFDFFEPRPKDCTMSSRRLFEETGMYLRPFEAFESALRTL